MVLIEQWIFKVESSVVIFSSLSPCPAVTDDPENPKMKDFVAIPFLICEPV